MTIMLDDSIIACNGMEKAEFLATNLHTYFFRLDKTNPQTHARHRHDFFSIDYIYDGTFTQIINGKKISCPKGSICLLSPFDIHQYFNESPASMISIVFNDDVILSQIWDALSIDNAPYITILNESDGDRMMRELEIIETEYQNPSHLSNAVIKSTISRIVVEILRKSSPTLFPRPQKHDSVHKAIAYVRYNFLKPITLEETAKIYHVTPSHFCKYFKKHTGSTFKEYIVSLRLDYAMRLIKNSNQSITEICFESGFSSPSYFTKAFLKRFGVLPSQIRN